jgi:hypothetical protein
MALAVSAACLAFTSVLSAQTWFNLGGAQLGLHWLTATNRPSNGLDQLDLYAKGSDQKLYVNAQVYSCRNRSGHPICRFFFTGWTRLGDLTMFGGANAVGWGNHREVFAAGHDSRLWHNWTDGDNTQWSGWYSLGGPPAVGAGTTGICESNPQAVSWAAGRIDVFAVGCDRQLWHIHFDSAHGWSAWENVFPGFVDILTSSASAYPGSLLVGIDSSHGEAVTIACNDGACNASSTWSVNHTGFLPPSPATANSTWVSPSTSIAPQFAEPPYAVIVVPADPDNQQIDAWGSLAGGQFWNSTPSQTVGGQLGYAYPVSVGGYTNDVFYLDGTGHIAYQRFVPEGWNTSFGTKTVGTDLFNDIPTAVAGVTAGSAYVFSIDGSGNVVYTYVIDSL